MRVWFDEWEIRIEVSLTGRGDPDPRTLRKARSGVVSNRRYREDEVGEIFALAASAADDALPSIPDPEGFTLEELQEVGREVGLSPERVAAAAATLDGRAQPAPRRTSLGAPVSVHRVVELPRAPTDDEWEDLVTELRTTFRAKGRMESHGRIREWRNGPLEAVIEPSTTGYRLRLGTRKRVARAVNMIGIVPTLLGLFVLVAGVIGGATIPSMATLIPTLLLLSGGSVLVRNHRRLRRWADEREGQMDHIAERAWALLSGSSEK